MALNGQSAQSAAPKVAHERQRGIDRVISLLEALLREHKPTRIGDLARRIGAPRSTTYEIVARLVEAEILEPCGPGGEIYFGRAAHLFGRAYADANPLFRRVGEVMERLASETHATTQFCGLRGNKYTVIDSRDGAGLFRITTDIGVEVPAPWTASGRLLLDHMSPEEIRAFVPPEDFRLPDGRTLAVESFLADVARARATGRCATTGLADPFTYCLAAPIRDRAGIARTTLCFVIPADTPEPRRVELLDRLAAEAELLAER
ncbi:MULTISPECIES: IclR family transcriptional regulator [Rhodomicrobium]|uniref:IclR family transcriptional regulator n=1 Tax=Rhodomicrobium TaxID=1068 RepID=UPI000B4B6D3C|nr:MULTISPECIES: IclR family transcriptional regulator [Rhodomicrobium]